MDAKRLVGIATLLVCAGCGTLTQQVGMDVSDLKDRYQVRAKFGEPDPDQTNECDPQWTSDSFTTRRKIAVQNADLPFRWMATAYTLGMYELIVLPLELQLLREEMFNYSRQLISSSTLQFLYDSDGKVQHILLDGYRVGPRVTRRLGEAPEKFDKELHRWRHRIDLFEPEAETAKLWNMEFPPLTELK